ncbi:MAG: DUF4097 family beta strand repeat protein [Acidobacteriota bacterium]|nr:DUF4097 family beta strand repeat protein [Acidobacteriota bacterium]
MRNVPALAGALVLTGVLCGCDFAAMGPSDRFQTDFHYTYDLAANGRINAESFNGPIEISGWDQNKVEITGAKYGATEELRDDVKVEVHNTAGSVDIRASKGSAARGGMGARIVIHAPKTAILGRISTSNGSIRLRDVASAAHLSTSNGPIDVSNVASDVDAHSSNGSIEVDRLGGGATLKTSNGHIRADGVAGPLEAETSNGGITAHTGSGASVKLATSNGAIDLTLDKAPRGDIKAETRNSGIKLRMPPGSAAHLVADTSNGSISSDFDLAAAGDNDRRHVSADIGGGGPTIQLNTSNSPIRILKGGAGN